jgi:hypothetical protein
VHSCGEGKREVLPGLISSTNKEIGPGVIFSFLMGNMDCFWAFHLVNLSRCTASGTEVEDEEQLRQKFIEIHLAKHVLIIFTPSSSYIRQGLQGLCSSLCAANVVVRIDNFVLVFQVVNLRICNERDLCS